MTEPEKKKRRGRPRGERIEVWLSPAEREQITQLAAKANLSASAYLRAAGLNAKIKATADLGAVRELAKVNGDLGRVAGLLKLWLAEKRGQGARPADVEAMMKDFRSLQAQMVQLMGRVSK